MMGLQGVEMVLIGYNTPSVNAEKSEEGPEKRLFHNRLCPRRPAPTRIRPGSCASPRPASRMAIPLIGGSLIVNPDGEIVVEARTEGRRTAGLSLRSRRHRLRQEHDLQLRPAPPHRALRPDHQPHRRGAASGKLDVRYLLPRT